MPTIAETWIKEGEKLGLRKGEKLGLRKGEKRRLRKGEQLGLQRGKLQGLLSGVEAVLEIRYGQDGLSLLPEIKKRADAETLKAIIDAVRQGKPLDELRRMYADK